MQKPTVKTAEPLWTRNFILITVANLLVFLGFQLLLPTIPVYVTELGGRESMVGLVVGVFTVSAVAVRPLVGQALGRYGRKPLLAAGLAVFIAAAVLYNWAASVAVLLLLRLVHGFGWGASSTAAGTVAADVVPKTRLGEGMGYFGLAATLSMAVAPALGLLIIDEYSFTVLFFCSAALAAAALIVSSFITSDVKTDPSKIKKGRGAMFERQAYRPSAVMFFVTATYGGVVSFIALYAGQRGIENIGIFFTVYAAVLSLSRPIFGAVLDRKGFDIVVIPGIILVAAALPVLSAADSLAMFLLAAVLYALGFGAVHPAMQAMAVKNLPPHRRGAANGTFFSAFDLGIGTGSVVLGAVSQSVGYAAMYLIAVIPALIALILYIMLGKKQLTMKT